MQTLDRADALRANSQFKAARKIFATWAPQRGQDPEMALRAWQGLADCCRLLGDFKAATAAYQKALPLALDAATKADLTAGLGLAFRGAGQPALALKSLTQAQRGYKKLKDTHGLAFTAWALGGAWRIAGEPKKGEAELKTAWKLYQKLRDAEGLSYTACALGGVARMMGRWADNRKHYTDANARMRARKDTFGIAYSYCGLGNACRMEGDLDGALVYFRKAEKVYATIGDKVSYAYTLWSIATTQKLLWQGRSALATLKKAEQLFQGTGDERGLAYIAMTRAEIYFLQRKKTAIPELKKAYRLSEKFLWESRHAHALHALMLGQVKAVDGLYRSSGSSFRPRSFPISWP